MNSNEANRTLKLAYLPKNAFFDDILVDVTESLALDGFIGVQSSKEMRNIWLNEQVVAVIEFHHPSVRLVVSFTHSHL